MRAVIRTLVALVLAVPIYQGLFNTVLNPWFIYGNGWRTLDPVLNVFNAMGIYQSGNIILGTVFAFSFAVALVLVWAVDRLIHRMRSQRAAS